MIHEIFVPKLGSVEENITLVKWIKDDGEYIEKDEPVVIIESEKTSGELEAPASGLLFSLTLAGTVVCSGDVVGIVADTNKDFERYKSGLKSLVQEGSKCMSKSGEIITPSAARLSEDSSKGEFLKREVIKSAPYEGLRRAIGERMMASLQNSAQVTVVSEADLTELDAYRKKLHKNRPEPHITFVDIFVKLLPEVLKDFPELNSSIENEKIIFWGSYNIGVAVALDQGLLVPVIYEASSKCLVDISWEIKRLTEKARKGKLEPHHLNGGTFTITSSGKANVDIITPILNPPQSAILAVGRIRPRPTVYMGEIAIRTMTFLSLTHDHRIIDGKPADDFLSRLKEVLENPKIFQEILK